MVAVLLLEGRDTGLPAVEVDALLGLLEPVPTSMIRLRELCADGVDDHPGQAVESAGGRGQADRTSIRRRTGTDRAEGRGDRLQEEVAVQQGCRRRPLRSQQGGRR